MAVLRNLWPFGQKNATLDFAHELLNGSSGKSGVNVTPKTALQITTALAAVRVLSDGVAQVPLKLIRETADGKERNLAKDHSLYRVLHRKPNDWQTSFEFRETLMMHAALCGNFFAFKNIVQGRVAELIPFEPGDVTVKRKDDFSLEYSVRGEKGGTQVFPAAAIWHVKGPSWNSWMGLEPVKLAREALGLALATEEHHALLHANGSNPGGLLSVEGTLSDAQYKDLRGWVDQNYSGRANAWRTMILDRGAKFTRAAMSGVDSQHLETRRFQIEEICRVFRVMPIMVGSSDKAATYASAEQMFLAHVVHTLSPWYQRIEQSIDVNLLTEKDYEDGVYSKFIVEGLLRGAIKDMAEYLVKTTQGGIMTRNEARAKLDLNPLPGLDEPLTPANMNVGDAGTNPDDDANDKPKDGE